ncbi:hypothetical protein llap_5462 [Limosa lapponica baueri]|uniref:Uncharacterized protein n=1 Tax=Limosa lapponica baueri TaxID=1758121 RepID=A0A2I0UDV5_LIMLA|nr:hypothetical protein llap_5462 [Limosa lapponica baueri]
MENSGLVHEESLRELDPDDRHQLTFMESGEFLNGRNIKYRHTSIYFPQANREAELFRQVVKDGCKLLTYKENPEAEGLYKKKKKKEKKVSVEGLFLKSYFYYTEFLAIC